MSDPVFRAALRAANRAEATYWLALESWAKADRAMRRARARLVAAWAAAGLAAAAARLSALPVGSSLDEV